MQEESRFNRRAFVAISLGLSGLGLPITGYMNHIYAFDPLPGARHAWMAAHNALSVVFLIFALWHLKMNFAAFARYLRENARQFVRRREWLAALLVVGGSLLLFVGHALVLGQRS